MTASIEIPTCPHCGSPYAVRILTPAHAVELANPKKAGFNPFDLFTSSYTQERGSTASTDLAGGCLLAIIGILTSPILARIQERKDKSREQKQDLLRQQYKKILDGCPTLYTCSREGIVFVPGHGREIPVKQILILLNHNETSDILMESFRQ